MNLARRQPRGIPIALLAVLVAGATACGSGKGGTSPIPGKLLDQQKVTVGGATPTTLMLGMGSEAASLTFPAHATTSQQDVQVALTTDVSKSGATPVNGTVIEIVTLNIILVNSAVLQQVLPAPPAGRTYMGATAAPGDSSWTIVGPARDAGPAPASADGGTGLELYEIDVRGTGLWTIVLQDLPDGGGTGGGAAGNTAGAGGANDGGAGSADTGGAAGSQADGAASDGAAGASDGGDAPGGSDGAAGSTLTGVGQFLQVATAFDGHTCALRTDGTVVCWGENGLKQSAPVPSDAFTQIVVNIGSSCGLHADGSVVCWGGGGAVPGTDSFTTIASGNNITSQSGGGAYLCGVKRSDGTIVCFGGRGYAPSAPPGSFSSVAASGTTTDEMAGACGITTADGSIVCTGSPFLGPPTGSFTQVSLGIKHACAVKSNGSIVCWGTDSDGDTTAPGGTGYTAVSLGTNHSCAIHNGTVVCWGDNTFGQSAPPKGTFTQISAGADHTCGLLADKSLVCWGSAAVVPQPLQRVATAIDHTCGIGVDGRIACWGFNYVAPAGSYMDVSSCSGNGAPGSCGVKTDGTVACWGQHTSVNTTPAGTFTRVTTDGLDACGLKSDGTLACWGDATVLQTPPTGTFTDFASTPEWVCAIRTDGSLNCFGVNGASPPTGSFKQISISETHGCAVATDASVACWGAATNGDTTAPNGSFLQVAVGSAHSCAIWTDHTLTCWGSNSAGQSSAPVDGTYTQISAGGNHTCAIDSNKQLWCWGDFYMQPL